MPLQFAVVREDWQLEAELVRRTRARCALVVASGGCTALSLSAQFPELEVVAFDLNPAQLEHLERKARAAQAGLLADLNVGDARPTGLNQCGAFESLFRLLRMAFVEWVAPADALERFFDRSATPADRVELRERWMGSRYWSAIFSMAFADGVLAAMFGPAATQHAERGSYPGYFQRAFERGFRRDDAASNPFLQHVWLGRYLEAPAYAQPGRSLSPRTVKGSLLDVDRLERFELFSLSNVFDWSDDALVCAWADALARQAKPGAAVLIRQLNNQRALRAFFEPGFAFDSALSSQLLARDRSLFYERIEVGFRVAR